MTRSRECRDQETDQISDGCKGPSEETRICNTHRCIGLRRPCNCFGHAIRCKSNCPDNQQCELTNWFAKESKDNRYECFEKSQTTCNGWGDPHITTFDRAKIDVFGTAQYLLSEHDGTGTNDAPFKILMNTVAYKSISVMNFLYTSFKSRTGVWIEVETGNDGSSSYYTKNTGWVPLISQKNDDFQFDKAHLKMTLTTWFGLEIVHNKHWFQLRVPGYYNSGCTGICQNKNWDRDDDYTTRNGTVLTLNSGTSFGRTLEEFEVAKSWIEGANTNRGWRQYEDGVGTKDPVGDPGPDHTVDLECPTGHKAQVQAECNSIFQADWIKPCVGVIDPTQTIHDCYIDYCMDTSVATKSKILYKFINECANKLAPKTEILCNWPKLSGVIGIEPLCGENQVWDGCAEACDIPTCGDVSECDHTRGVVGACLCVNGFLMHNGECILESQCPSSHSVSQWSDWSECSKTCGSGTSVRSRICLGPGACDDDLDDIVACNTCSCISETTYEFTSGSNFVPKMAHLLWNDDWSSISGMHFSVDADDSEVRLILSKGEAEPDGQWIDEMETVWEVQLGANNGTLSKILAKDQVDLERSHTRRELKTWKLGFYLHFNDTYLSIIDQFGRVIIERDGISYDDITYLSLASQDTTNWRITPFPGNIEVLNAI